PGSPAGVLDRSPHSKVGSISVRRSANMNMRSGGCPGDRLAKREERNAISAQEAKQRLSLGAIGMQRNVHRVVMIEAPAIVNRTLTKHSDRQRPLERVLEKPLHFECVRQSPSRPAIVPNHRSSAYKAASWNRL